MVRLTRGSNDDGACACSEDDAVADGASREVRTMDATARLPRGAVALSAPVGAATLALVAANGWPRPGAADAFAPREAPVAGGTRLPGTPPTPMVLRSPGYDPEASRW
mmetsp:Transcript_11477/g.49453  ORF Transcript_11477/g.49453 Transcript_11477/m.49453 type:complete len:108 (+) Transcript_11477:2384-2707(+)